MVNLIDSVRQIRDKNNLPLKKPVLKVKVISSD